MSRRILIEDKKSHLLTLVYWGAFLNTSEGKWLPDVPGYVVADRDEDFNTTRRALSADTDTTNLYCYCRVGEGKIIRVLKLYAICDSYAGVGSPIWNDSGTGLLYKEGEAILVEGDLKWKLL